jgi:hypothetical protein
VAVSLTNVSLRSEIQGLINLPREKVASISFLPTMARTNLSASIRSEAPKVTVRTNTQDNLIALVQSNYLAGASPQAVQNYNQLAASFLNGGMSLADLQKQAKETLSAVEQQKQGLGPEADELIEPYLSILRNFLREAAPEK